MGKFNFGIDPNSAADADLGEGFYIGDVPPKGNYHGVIKQVKMKLNSSGDPRLNVLVEVSEPDDSEKAAYNGAALWCGLNVNDSGTPWINNWLDAIGANRKDFWAEKITTSPGKLNAETALDVLKIGTRKVVGHEVFVTGQPRTYNGNESFEVKRFLEDDGLGGGARDSGASAEAEPDETATGLGDDGDGADAGETDADAGYTEEELTELDLADLQAICKDWDIKFVKTGAKKDSEANLIAKILALQEEGDADTGDAGADEADALTEEDLEEMGKPELIQYMTDKGWGEQIPTPAVPSRLRKQILKLQAEPPF